MASVDDETHEIRNLISRLNAIFDIVNEEGYENELNVSFMKSLKDLEESWLNYIKKLEK